MNRFREALLTNVSLTALLSGDRADINAELCAALKGMHSVHFATGGGFQTGVQVQPAPAVEGDFASTNPRFTFDAGAGGLVAGSGLAGGSTTLFGVTVGRFAWAYPPHDPNGGPTQVQNYGSGPVTGFVHREQQGLITQYLADASLVVPQGFPLTLFIGGDFWVKNNGTTPAYLGMQAYANLANGAASFAAAGSVATASVTASIAASTATFVGSISGDVLTVTSVTSGTIVAGGAVTGTGATAPSANTTITSQISGATGGTGTYYINNPEQTVPSGTLTETYGILSVTNVTSGTIVNGGAVTGSGVSAGTVITQFGTGAGGSGTYYVNNTQTIGSVAMIIGTNIGTKWYALSSGLPGELVKISSQQLG